MTSHPLSHFALNFYLFVNFSFFSDFKENEKKPISKDSLRVNDFYEIFDDIFIYLT